ncbi:MAG: DUF6285 domain-containing protein [Burkholderiaceae bacterium]
MINRPRGDELLAVARSVLLDDLLPLIPADRAYDARMIANAMAIAARELARCRGVDDEVTERIAEFYRAIGMDPSVIASEQSLADQIKKRHIDSVHARQLHALLLAVTGAKLAISNPKYLDQ